MSAYGFGLHLCEEDKMADFMIRADESNHTKPQVNIEGKRLYSHVKATPNEIHL